jgi:TonB family protein
MPRTGRWPTFVQRGTVAALACAATLALGASTATRDVEVTPPLVILETQKPPTYPPVALKGRFNGSVVVEVLVLPDGSVGQAKVIECSAPNLGFEAATTEAVQRWRFEPAMHGDQAVEYTMRFRMNFKGGAVGRGVTVAAGAMTDAHSSSSMGSAPPPTRK